MSWSLWLGAKSEACISCGKTARHKQVVCEACQGRIPFIRSHEIQCGSCGRPEHCPDCPRFTGGALAGNRSAVRYDELMKEWLALYKYRGHERLGELLVDSMFHAFCLLDLQYGFSRSGKIPILTYVPLNSQRERERGFNQAEQLAKGLAKRCGLQTFPLLARARHTEKQSSKSRRHRLESLRGAFVLREDTPITLGGRPIILIDDVYTTGATVHECAEVLARRYADNAVYACTWARSIGRME